MLKTCVKYKFLCSFYLNFALLWQVSWGLDYGDQPTQESLVKECRVSHCSCPEVGVVRCDDSNLTRIPENIHDDVRHVIISNSRLLILGSDEISWPKVQSLRVTNNSFLESVDHSWLSGLTRLQLLDLSYNRLTSIGMSPMKNLISLDLNHNTLSQVSSLDLPSLKHLNLSHNLLTQFSDLHNLTALESLDLSANRFSLLKTVWFTNLTNLRLLDLRGNRLRNLSSNVFWRLPRLQRLDLSENQLLNVGLLTFRNLGQLTHLNLSFNNLSHLQDNCLKALVSLEWLDLSHNPLSRFNNIFSTLSNLRRLLLYDMPRLKELTADSFLGLESLEQLFLSRSSLSVIRQHAFQPLQRLSHLDLSRNNLSALPQYLFRPLTHLSTLVLRDNPWQCDCHLYWILLWLGNNVQTHVLEVESTLCHAPPPLHGLSVLDSLDHRMACVNVTIKNASALVHFRMGSTALLQCATEGTPRPSLIWITPKGQWFRSSRNPSQTAVRANDTVPAEILPLPSPLRNGSAIADYPRERFLLLRNGNLMIRELQKGDNGFYHCVASNPLGNASATVRLTLDYDFLTRVKLVSVLVGLATSLGFLLATLLFMCLQASLRRCGIEIPCACCGTSPKAQQIKRILESMEQYKSQQLERLRDNYTFQVQRIKDNCLQQMERLRESYSGQVEHLRNIREYGNLQIDRIRDNYYQQVQRVRDYSTSQIDRLRENYIFQRNRIRKFSTHQLVKLRENYKLQQQHVNKILETLNLENCKNVCARTDSIMFEPELTMDPAEFIAHFDPLPPHDCGEISSQLSAYFTPDGSDSETLNAGDEEVNEVEIILTPQSSTSYYLPDKLPQTSFSYIPPKVDDLDINSYRNGFSKAVSVPLLVEDENDPLSKSETPV